MYQLLLRYKVPSWNQAARKHYRIVMRLYQEAKDAVDHALYEAKGERPRSWPVCVSFHAAWKGRKRRDIDSLLLKPILDRLVDREILPDDSLAYVTKIIVTGNTGASEDTCRISIEKPV